jgi:hypothetical protein
MVAAAMRRLIYQVAVGEVPAFYGPCMSSVNAYAERIGANHVIQASPVLRIVPKKSQRSENALRLGYLPIFEKEQAFAYLGEYDQVAIIDADIFIRPSAPDLFEAAGDADFAGVLESELPLREQYEKKVRNYARDMFGDPEFPFYNMGMTVWNASMKHLLRGQSPKEFIERAEFEPFVNGEGKYRWSTDQVLLNTWVKSTGMTRRNLDWRWNCLYDYVIPTALRMNPYFIHFNLASKLPRGGDEIPEIIAGLA